MQISIPEKKLQQETTIVTDRSDPNLGRMGLDFRSERLGRNPLFSRKSGTFQKTEFQNPFDSLEIGMGFSRHTCKNFGETLLPFRIDSGITIG